MYAVIATGGKQYRVAEGDVVRIEKLAAEPGATVHATPEPGKTFRFGRDGRVMPAG